MAGEQYVEAAVAALVEHFEDGTYGLDAQITAMRTALSVSSTVLPATAGILSYEAPPFDTRTPLVMCFDAGWAFAPSRAQQRHSILGVTVRTAVAVLSETSQAGMAAGELLCRRYMTAVVRSITQNPTLVSANATGAVLLSGGRDTFLTESAARHARFQDIEVRVHTAD